MALIFTKCFTLHYIIIIVTNWRLCFYTASGGLYIVDMENHGSNDSLRHSYCVYNVCSNNNNFVWYAREISTIYVYVTHNYFKLCYACPLTLWIISLISRMSHLVFFLSVQCITYWNLLDMTRNHDIIINIFIS